MSITAAVDGVSYSGITKITAGGKNVALTETGVIVTPTATLAKTYDANGTYTLDVTNYKTISIEVAVSGGSTKTLTGITAEYTGGSVTAGTATAELTGLTVTASYSDGSSEAVTGYTLSPDEIAEGENTITVTYLEQTCTFTVTGTAAGELTWLTADDIKTTIGLGGLTVSDDGTATVETAEDYSALILVDGITYIEATANGLTPVNFICYDYGDGRYGGYDALGSYYIFTPDDEATKLTPVASSVKPCGRTSSGTAVSKGDAFTFTFTDSTLVFDCPNSGSGVDTHIEITGWNCFGWWGTKNTRYAFLPINAKVKRG